MLALTAVPLFWPDISRGEPNQVARGEAVFQQNCMACHGGGGRGGFEAPSLNGMNTRRRFSDAQKIYNFASQYMPFNRPGALRSDQYWDVVSYILSLQGMDLQGVTVDASTASDLDWNRAAILVYVGNTRLTTDVPPELRNGRTLVPVRSIFEALGADITWDGDSRTVTAVKDGRRVVLQIDNRVATVDGSETMLDQAPVIRGGRTLVPLRFVSEALGASVSWDGTTRSVQIDP